MTEILLAKASRTFAAPSIAKEYGYRQRVLFRVTVEASQLNGNRHPHFSVTGEAWTAGGVGKHGDRVFCGGCMHEEAARFWPAVVPIIRLHLSNADDGAPMYAEGNGWYWLAGALPGFAGEQYCGATGSSAKTPERCLEVLADHLRVSLDEARRIRCECAACWPERQASPEVVGFKRCARKARRIFAKYVQAQADRWKREAEAGVALIRKLAAEAPGGPQVFEA